MNKEENFTKLYKDYGPGILKLCLGYTGDIVMAEDYLHETFIAVWNNMESFVEVQCGAHVFTELL